MLIKQVLGIVNESTNVGSKVFTGTLVFNVANTRFERFPNVRLTVVTDEDGHQVLGKVSGVTLRVSSHIDVGERVTIHGERVVGADSKWELIP